MKYYIPEWDDLVSSNYDFWNDKEFDDSERVYSHELYKKPNYDGLLVSRMKIEDSKSKFAKLKEMGVHNYFRFKGPIFGDCGAWGYVKDKSPPFTTEEIIEYYDQLKFDLGVSIDHLCLPNNKSEWYHRQNLTLKNAEKFYNLCESGGYGFKPVGACQGGDIDSFRNSVKEVLDIGYDYIALGGIARAQTEFIIKVLQSIQDLVEGKNIEIHLFGAARLDGIIPFQKLGVTSFDSASPLRSAWLGSEKNYRNIDWNGYSAIRLPFLTRDKKYKNLASAELTTLQELHDLERSFQIMLRRYEFDESRTPEELAEAFEMLNQEYIHSKDRRKDYIRTLKDKPWENCPCAVCKDVGMEVIIFRGNNRNRRRGFHNTWVFYELLQKILKDPNYELPTTIKQKPIPAKIIRFTKEEDDSDVSTNENSFSELEDLDSQKKKQSKLDLYFKKK